MIKNKVLFSILTCACLSFIPSIANAQVNGYLVKDSNTVYEYSVKDLLQSRLNDKKFFNEFQQHCAKFGLYAYKDENGKIVSQDDTLKAFLNNRNNFNLNKFVESDKSKSIKIDNIKKVSIDDKINNSTDNKVDNNKDKDKTNNKEDNKDNNKQDNSKIDIEKLKQEIKTPEDLEKFLNEDSRFNQLKTPMGIMHFTTKIDVNTSKDICSMACDFEVVQDWDKNLSPVNLVFSKKYTEKEMLELSSLMKNHQKKIADLSLSLFPNQKINGKFLSEDRNEIKRFKRYKPNILFHFWCNYNDDYAHMYGESKITNLHFGIHADTFWFNEN